MAAFLHSRGSFGTSFDFHTGLNFDTTHRKHSTALEEYNYNNNYPVFNDETTLTNKHASGSVDVLRSFSYGQQQSTSPNPPTNNFTFNHNITHVNLINNRFQIDIPATHHYNNNNNSSSNNPSSQHDYHQMSEPGMSMNISPAGSHQQTSSNIFSRSSLSNNPVSRLNSTGSYTTSHHGDSYSPPQPMINNSASASDHFMSMYHSSQGFQSGIKNTSEDFHNLPSLSSKFPSPEHPLPITSPIKSDEYSSNMYGYNDHHTSMMNGGNCNISSSLPVSNISRVPPIFTQTSDQRIRDNDVEQVNDAQKCKNTIEGTKTSVRRFKRWYKERYNKEIDMNSVNSFNAPELLKDFFLDIRDTRPGRVGNEYEPVTLTTYRNGLRRYFLYRKCPPAPDNFDLTDKTFDIVNRHLVTKRDDLKRKGKGNHPNAIESITAEQLEKMWASGAIGTHAPRPLLRLQWWYNTVYHGVRGRMAHHDLTTDDFHVSRALDGKLLMEYTKNGQHHTSPLSPKMEPPKKKKFRGVVKETDGGERDPIRAFEIFKAHRPEGISSFYLTPKHKPKGNVWFNKVPMGKNSIGRIMREIKAIAGI